jgi:uncharacterized membrane protein
MVNEDASITVYEKMIFDLEKQYNEGYRSIRPNDFDSLADITVNSVRVNGGSSTYALQMNGKNAEIVWKKAPSGQNIVEINYTVANRVELYNDFAKVCYEHYGANWKVTGQEFKARTTLPPKSKGRTMHFEVYSTKKGKAYIDDLSVVIEINNVPSGNYIGGCYLFDKSAVNTSKKVDASAYAILKDERKSYGSEVVLAAEKPNAEYCCIPMFLLSLILAIVVYLKEGKRPKELPETLLPPGKEEPAVVSALVRNRYEIKELVSATIVDLISRGVIDIIELEKKDAKGSEISRERTVLILKKRPANLKPYEESVVDFLFADGKEVDLDAKINEYDSIESKEEAKKQKVVETIEKLNKEFQARIERLFTEEEIKKLSKRAVSAQGEIGAAIFLIVFVGMFLFACAGSSLDPEWYSQHGEQSLLLMIVLSGVGFLICSAYAAIMHLKPNIPKKAEYLELYSKWNAFYRGLDSTRIKEYPPASALIWGNILTYAVALGKADKVNKHLSELDAVLAKQIEKTNRIATTSMRYYTHTLALSYLATYGSRSEPSSHGSFSSRSSGGWSRGGGGGFSGRSSGGGGFR